MAGAAEAVAVTSGPRHHFFGYYDKCPWDATGQLLLCLETSFKGRTPGPGDSAIVGMVALEHRWVFQPVTRTQAWNWQQGAMFQWMPSAPDRLVAFNIRSQGRFRGVVRDVFSGEELLMPLPVCAVSPDGDTVLSLNFSRLADVRPGYGYAGVPDPWQEDPYPADDGIYAMSFAAGEYGLILSLQTLAEFRPKSTMVGAKHWVNHIQFNRDGSRFAFLHRWRNPAETGWHSRLLTANADGSELWCVADEDLVSHYDWRDSSHILAWAKQRDQGEGFFLFTDRTEERRPVGEGVLTRDGHCSYSPDGRWILTDTYPDADRMRALLLFRPDDGSLVELGRFFSPPELSGPVRCDLHPRWNRDGTKICFDSVHEGTRQVYVMDVGDIVAGP